ncbi:hypothetical protein BVRB_018300, partial [Beta vulgaris subsp. vulgaris]
MSYSKACTISQLDAFANLTKTYAGRDKCTKAIQYGSRVLMYLLLKDDPKNQLGNRFKGLFAMTRDARKIWRFPNVVTEYKTILTVLDNTKDGTLIQALQILSRAAFAYYWINDSLVFLCKSKFMTRDPANLNLHAQRGWFFGIFFGLLMQFVQL